MGRRLSWSRRDLEGDPVGAAELLLGSTLRSLTAEGVVAVRLTEVEAYGGADDPGSHAFRGQTARNHVMFGAAGYAYVYFSYGMHWCVNVVCGSAGTAGAVLLRAGEVVEGLDLARTRRPGASDRDLARGPACLSRALAVTGTANGLDLLPARSTLRLLPGTPVAASAVAWGPRVGVSGTGALTPWRAYLQDEATVSAYRPAAPRRKPTSAP